MIPLVPAWRVDRVFDYLVPGGLEPEVVPGCLVRVPLGHRKVRGVVLDVVSRRAERELLPIERVILSAGLAAPPLDELLRWLARRYVVPLGRSFAKSVPPRVRVRRDTPVHLTRGETPQILPRYAGGEALTAAIESGRPGLWALRVVPGEDHAAVVAELVGAAGRCGDGAALIAVPEVEHGSRTLDGLRSRWPELARVDTSQSPADRSAALLRLASGHGLGGGGRGVVFAPSPRVRLIVVDDEHDPAYKEDRSPRYDARRVAAARARLEAAVCVFLSVTPSAETGAAALAGSIGSVEPSRSAEKSRRPLVETAPPPEGAVLSRLLHTRIRDALRSGRRVALLAPGRGWAPVVWCAACKRSIRCARCESGMQSIRTGTALRCPRCGHTSPEPIVCRSCGSGELRYLGAGSERLEDQLASAFPRASVRRVDPDVGLSPGGDPDIYVTTWIGTKPSVRPGVSLVGVVDADMLIRRPDFRAGESAYQALASLAEWAGPAANGGHLVVQTAEPAHHSIQAVIRGDYHYWLERELTERKELGYPPYSELVRVQATGAAGPRLIDDAATAARAAGGRVLGPIMVTSSPGARPSEILVKCPDAEPVALALRDILIAAPAGSRLSVDVDPR